MMTCACWLCVTCSSELPHHKIPETATTPMAELIVDSEYDATELTAPLRGASATSSSHLEIDAALKKVEREPTEFTVYPLSDVKPASEAICQPPEDPDAKKEEEAVAEKMEEDEEAEEEIAVTNTIQVAVPGRTATPAAATPAAATAATATATATAEASDEEGEVEELRVVQFDGKVVESIKVE